MKKLLMGAVLALILVSAISAICNNGIKDSCYDETLAAKYRLIECKSDGAEVTGCNGEKFRNECEAAKNGIRVIH